MCPVFSPGSRPGRTYDWGPTQKGLWDTPGTPVLLERPEGGENEVGAWMVPGF